METSLQWQKAEDWLPGDRDREGGEITKRLEEISEVMNMFIILFVVWLHRFIHIKTYQFVLFKYAQFIICQLYLDKA